MVRAVIGVSDLNSLRSKLRLYPLRKLTELPVVIIPSRNATLISNDDDHIAFLLRSSAKIEDTFHKVTVFWFVNVAMIDVDDAISIEQ